MTDDDTTSRAWKVRREPDATFDSGVLIAYLVDWQRSYVEAGGFLG
jgi:hypothetical protein